MRKSTFFFLIFLAFLLFGLMLFTVNGRFPFWRKSRRPNVVILTIDTLRGDHVGFLGYKLPTTPNLDSFSKSCFIFTSAYAPRGETSPALSSAFTGLYPSLHGVYDNHCILPPGLCTIAGLASKAGYESAAFLANKAIAPSKLARDFKLLRFTTSSERPQWQDDEAALSAALSFLQKRHTKPFFLWVHFMDPHSPYEPGPKQRGLFAHGAQGLDGTRETLEAITQRRRPISKAGLQFIRSLYDEEIRGTDERIGRILSGLKNRGLLENTVVVIFSDHGEELGDHHLYFFHQVSVYRQVLHVPLLWHLPKTVLGKEVKARKISLPVGLVDVAPTLASLLGLNFPGEVNGISLKPIFLGKAIERREVFAEYGRKITSVITARWHAIHNPQRFSPYGGPFPTPEERRRNPKLARLPFFKVEEKELYDLLHDPLEQENLAQIESSVCKKLLKSIRAFRRSHPYRKALRVGSEAALRVLADLGYIQGPKKESKAKSSKAGSQPERR